MRTCLIVVAGLLGSCSASHPNEATTPSTRQQPVPTSQAVGPSARVLHEGTLSCIPGPERNADGTPVTCEPSGVARLGDNVWIANDKPLPGRSPLMRSTWTQPNELADPIHVEDPILASVLKYEDLAAAPDGTGLLASTGFDRDDVRYNLLLAWQPGGKPVVVEPTTRQDYTCSISLRAEIRRALADDDYPQGPAHLKVEGLALLPDGRLLLGVREIGDSWMQPHFVVRILESRWSADDPSALELPLRPAWSFVPEGIPAVLGLSDLAWDEEHERLLLLTSYELGTTDEELGAYLWTLPLADYDAGLPPRPVRTADGELLHFAHKAEGVAPLGDGRVLVVHDDDRVTGRPAAAIADPDTQFSRALHQAAYAVLELTEPA